MLIAWTGLDWPKRTYRGQLRATDHTTSTDKAMRRAHHPSGSVAPATLHKMVSNRVPANVFISFAKRIFIIHWRARSSVKRTLFPSPVNCLSKQWARIVAEWSCQLIKSGDMHCAWSAACERVDHKGCVQIELSRSALGSCPRSRWANTRS